MKTQIVDPQVDKESLNLAIEALKNGEVVALPTETVYGLAARMDDPKALLKIFQTKSRPLFDPLIVHVSDALLKSVNNDPIEALSIMGLIDIKEWPASKKAQAQNLIQNFWPGPLTLIFPKGPLVPDLATSGLPTVAIRMPDHPLAQQIITSSGAALCAPSANRFGRISPTTAFDVFKELDGLITWIIDGGPSLLGIESTILALHLDTPLIARPGALDATKLLPIIRTFDTKTKNVKFAAPGTLPHHYAPTKLLYLCPGRFKNLTDRDPTLAQYGQTFSKLSVGVLTLAPEPKSEIQKTLPPGWTISHQIALSLKGEADICTHNLFKNLRQLDEDDCELIIAESPLVPLLPPEDQGLFWGIYDRLYRASQKMRDLMSRPQVRN